MTTSTLDGTCSRNCSSSVWVTIGPVGLLGVQTMTTFVRSVIAASIASRRCRSWSSSPTLTDVAPASAVTIGYASKERQAWTTSSPGSQVAAITWPRTPTEPVPVAMCSAGTPKLWARASVRSVTAMSGYRLTLPAASVITSSTEGSGGNGFSFDDTLYAATPSGADAGFPG